MCCATPPTSGRGCQPSPVCLSQLPLHGKAHICRESKLGKLQLLEQVSLGREHRGKKNTTLLPVTKRDAVYFGFQQHGAQPHKLFPAPVSSIPLEPAVLKRRVRLHSCHYVNACRRWQVGTSGSDMCSLRASHEGFGRISRKNPDPIPASRHVSFIGAALSRPGGTRSGNEFSAHCLIPSSR